MFSEIFADPSNLSYLTIGFYAYSLFNFWLITSNFGMLESSAGKRYMVSGSIVVLGLFFWYAMVVQQSHEKVPVAVLTCAGLIFATAMLQMRYFSLMRTYAPIQEDDSFKTKYYKRAAERVMIDYSFFRPTYIGAIIGVMALAANGGSGEAGIVFALICTIIFDLYIDYKYWCICFKRKMLDNIYADEGLWFIAARPLIGLCAGLFVAWLAIDSTQIYIQRVIALGVILTTYTLFKPFMFHQIKNGPVD